MLKPILSGQYKKDYKLAKKRGLDVTPLDNTVNMLLSEKPLPPANKDHPLHGPLGRLSRMSYIA